MSVAQMRRGATALSATLLMIASMAMSSCSSESEYHTTPCPPTHIGRLSVKGQVLNCPTITVFQVSPTQLGPRDEAQLTATAVDVDSNNLSFAWTATSGTIADPSVASTTFRCSGPGPVTVNLTVSDGQCDDASQAPINCTP
jgi:hypothetical protein